MADIADDIYKFVYKRTTYDYNYQKIVSDYLKTHLGRWNPPPFNREEAITNVGSSALVVLNDCVDLSRNQFRRALEDISLKTSSLTHRVGAP